MVSMQHAPCMILLHLYSKCGLSVLLFFHVTWLIMLCVRVAVFLLPDFSSMSLVQICWNYAFSLFTNADVHTPGVCLLCVYVCALIVCAFISFSFVQRCLRHRFVIIIISNLFQFIFSFSFALFMECCMCVQFTANLLYHYTYTYSKPEWKKILTTWMKNE